MRLPGRKSTVREPKGLGMGLEEHKHLMAEWRRVVLERRLRRRPTRRVWHQKGQRSQCLNNAVMKRSKRRILEGAGRPIQF